MVESLTLCKNSNLSVAVEVVHVAFFLVRDSEGLRLFDADGSSPGALLSDAESCSDVSESQPSTSKRKASAIRSLDRSLDSVCLAELAG